MAIVQGIREKVHLPIYDCLQVPSGKTVSDVESSSTFRFFVNVQGKTKLLTNLQSASLLPHYNTFEARAMRVVIGEPPAKSKFPDGLMSVTSFLIFTTVTTLYVGEKTMIQMPTWNFPGGAGPYAPFAGTVTHGEPSPLATFRFAEPVIIDKQQNFRVEMEAPDTNHWNVIKQLPGPFFVWVVLDGYMTRDVQ